VYILNDIFALEISGDRCRSNAFPQIHLPVNSIATRCSFGLRGVRDLGQLFSLKAKSLGFSVLLS